MLSSLHYLYNSIKETISMKLILLVYILLPNIVQNIKVEHGTEFNIIRHNTQRFQTFVLLSWFCIVWEILFLELLMNMFLQVYWLQLTSAVGKVVDGFSNSEVNFVVIGMAAPAACTRFSDLKEELGKWVSVQSYVSSVGMSRCNTIIILNSVV